MTVSADPATISYAGAGSAGPFAIPFYFLADAHVRVTKTVDEVTTVLVLDVDYTLTGALNEAGGALTLAAALAVDATLLIQLEVPIDQLQEYNRNDPFPAESIERALDKLTMICKQLEASITNFDDAELADLIDLLLADPDFLTLMNSLLANIYTETDYILQLGMLRYLIPILSIAGTAATVDKTYESALVRCTNAAPVTVTIRENDDTVAADFSTGAFISFKQTTVGGQVTLVPPGASVFTVPTGFLAKTRALNSIITATCELAAGGVWTLSGDLAIDAAASVGQAVHALTSAAGVVAIDCSMGDFFTLTPTENVSSFTFSNLPATGYAQRINLRFTQHASSAKTVALTQFKRPAGAGAVSSGTGKVDELQLTTYDQGTRWELAIRNDLS